MHLIRQIRRMFQSLNLTSHKSLFILLCSFFACIPLKADLSVMYTSECKGKESSERELKVSLFIKKEFKFQL